MTWQEFQDLPGTKEVADMLTVANNKCFVIAHYRMINLLNAILADLQKKYPEKS